MDSLHREQVELVHTHPVLTLGSTVVLETCAITMHDRECEDVIQRDLWLWESKVELFTEIIGSAVFTWMCARKTIVLACAPSELVVCLIASKAVSGVVSALSLFRPFFALAAGRKTACVLSHAA